ncbi:MAG: hypothetical protein AB2588_17770 [Candidatus Thiodiazotropha sp.]
MDGIKDIFEAFSTRIRSPFFGYFFFSFFGINWKAVFFLLFSDDRVLYRIKYFEDHTSTHTLLTLPLLVGVVLALTYPWLSLAFQWAVLAPTKFRNNLNAQAEDSLIIKKLELEENRNAYIRAREERALEMAEREQKIENIQDEEIRKKAKEKLLDIRMGHEQIDPSNDYKNIDLQDMMGMPINNESLRAYTKKKYPNLPVLDNIQRKLLQDISKAKYKTLKDIDNALNNAKEFLKSYESNNPKVFKGGTDFITKALGYSDPDFRLAHAFSRETLLAFKNYENEHK